MDFLVNFVFHPLFHFFAVSAGRKPVYYLMFFCGICLGILLGKYLEKENFYLLLKSMRFYVFATVFAVGGNYFWGKHDRTQEYWICNFIWDVWISFVFFVVSVGGNSILYHMKK